MYKNNCKCISAVVATTLILSLVVITVISFQSWNNDFVGGLKSDIDSKYDKSTSSKLRLESLMNSYLYIKNIDENKDIEISNILINGNYCNITDSLSYGIKDINLDDCISNNNIEKNNKVIISVETSSGIVSKYFYFKESNIGKS